MEAQEGAARTYSLWNLDNFVNFHDFVHILNPLDRFLDLHNLCDKRTNSLNESVSNQHGGMTQSHPPSRSANIL